MSEELHSSEHVAHEQWHGAIAHEPARPSSRRAQWARTLIACGLLLGGLAAILPIMPDQDSRGLYSTHSAQPAPAASRASALSDPDADAATRDLAAAQAVPARPIHRT